MNAPVIARILGLLFLVAGILAALAHFAPLAFFAPAAPFDARVVTWDTDYRMLFGVFPVNLGHDAVHLLFGVWGLAAGMKFRSAVFYCRAVTWIYLIFVLFGIVPITNTLFGIAPVYGWDVLLHFVIVLLAAYGGYGRGSRTDEEALSS